MLELQKRQNARTAESGRVVVFKKNALLSFDTIGRGGKGQVYFKKKRNENFNDRMKNNLIKKLVIP